MKVGRTVRGYVPLAILDRAQVVIIAPFPSTSPAQGPQRRAPPGQRCGGLLGKSRRNRSRTHCTGGREFSTSINYYAPLCTPGTIGGSYDNGGSTSGVMDETVTVARRLRYVGGIVDTILRGEGLYVDYAQTKQANAAFQNFVNSHYVLWGRKLKIETYNSTCQTVPPDTGCLLAEMDSIVQTYHPVRRGLGDHAVLGALRAPGPGPHDRARRSGLQRCLRPGQRAVLLVTRGELDQHREGIRPVLVQSTDEQGHQPGGELRRGQERRPETSTARSESWG